MAARDYGQFDGVTRGLELVGERWALLIVRDLLVGPRRYGELAAGLPRIPSNILAARLKELQAAGVIRRDRPALYVENDRRDKSESLIRRLQDLNYRMFWHLPPLFNAANIYGNAVNVFPGIVSINMLCLPAESVNAVTGLQEVASPFDWPLAQ